ncbi:MAG: aromatic amino acid lyase, partial [Candidatus Nanopelagicales bacterium]
MSSSANASPVTIGTSGMTLDDVIAVARVGRQVSLSDEAASAMAATRVQIEALAHAAEPVYGVSTGFGALANRHIPAEMRTQLQRSLIRSHAAGMGAPVEREVVRALMLLRLKTLASGRTGVRPVVAETMAALLNAGITPVVREFGSLGCSGDLAPLSHCALVLMGEGEATGPDGTGRPVPELLAAAGIEPIELQEKEGLALINGTDGMLGMLILAIADLEHLCDVADLTASMSVEALLGTDQVFRPELHLPLRP